MFPKKLLLFSITKHIFTLIFFIFRETKTKNSLFSSTKCILNLRMVFLFSLVSWKRANKKTLEIIDMIHGIKRKLPRSKIKKKNQTLLDCLNCDLATFSLSSLYFFLFIMRFIACSYLLLWYHCKVVIVFT